MKYLPFLGLVSLCLVGCGSSEKTAETPTEEPKQETSLIEFNAEQIKNADLQYGVPVEKAMTGLLKSTGRVEIMPQNTVKLSFPFGGYVKAINLAPEQFVSKGQTLASIENPEFIQIQRDFLEAKNQLAYLEQESRRQQELTLDQLTPSKILQKTNADLQMQKIAVQALAQKLQLIGLNAASVSTQNLKSTIPLIAPESGIVSKINVSLGQYIAPTDILVELVNTSEVYANVLIQEPDMASVSVGQAIKLIPNDGRNTVIATTIQNLSSQLDENRAIVAKCRLSNPQNHLKAGMYLTANISTQNKNGLAVPKLAIVNYESKDFIYLVKDATHFEMHEVKLGLEEGDWVQITSASGFDLTNKQLVVKNAYTILGKMANTGDE